VSRYGRPLGTLLIGALLAGAYVIGILVGTEPREVVPGPEALRLGAYCRHLHGGRADAYQPAELDGWRCSVWRNGVWGLEEVDLAAACRWQVGPGSEPVTREGRADPAGRLICTI
jgi:hypothetical protein